MSSFSEGAAGCLLLCILVVGGLYLWYEQTQKDIRIQEVRVQQQLVARRAKIPWSRIETADFHLSDGYSPELTGRIANHSSRDTVDMVGFLITVYDCPKAKARLEQCTIVASDSAVAVETIPPAQARDFASFVPFPASLRIRGHMQWTYTITSVTASSP